MELADLVFELFGTAQVAEPGDGPGLERAVIDRLHAKGIRIESIPGGSRLYGFTSQSGLAHQLDLVVALDDADAIVELKAHRAAMPKNELLRFKAASDDFYLGLGHDLPTRPIYRAFGGPGLASAGMRRYAALHGIAIVEGDRWPAAVLASDLVRWPADVGGPSLASRSCLQSLIRPMQRVLTPLRDGYLVQPWIARVAVDAILQLQDEWSTRLWNVIDAEGPVNSGTSGWWAA